MQLSARLVLFLDELFWVIMVGFSCLDGFINLKATLNKLECLYVKFWPFWLSEITLDHHGIDWSVKWPTTSLKFVWESPAQIRIAVSRVHFVEFNDPYHMLHMKCYNVLCHSFPVCTTRWGENREGWSLFLIGIISELLGFKVTQCDLFLLEWLLFRSIWLLKFSQGRSKMFIKSLGFGWTLMNSVPVLSCWIYKQS